MTKNGLFHGDFFGFCDKKIQVWLVWFGPPLCHCFGGLFLGMWSEFSKVMFATSTWSKTLTASFSMSIVVFRRTIFSQHLRPISYLLSQHLRPTVSCIVDTVRGYMWIFGK